MTPGTMLAIGGAWAALIGLVAIVAAVLEIRSSRTTAPDSTTLAVAVMFGWVPLALLVTVIQSIAD